VFFLIADLGVTIATGVSHWVDRTANAFDAVQATTTAQPALQSAALNGRNTILADGVDDRLVVGTMDLPAPGTTPTWFWGVFNEPTDLGSATLFGGGSSTLMRIFRSSLTQMRCSNGVSGTQVTRVVNTWYRFEALFANSATSDYLKIGSTDSGVGTATGNNNPAAGAFTLFAQQTAGNSPGNFNLACLGAWSGNPTAAEKALLSAWVTGYYGASVNV